MAFWTSALSEPKRQHRFILRLPELRTSNGESAYAEYLAKTASKPSYSISEVPHKFLGNTFYYPGTVSWEPVTVQLINSIDPDGNQLLYDALSQSGYLMPDLQNLRVNQGDGSIASGIGTVNKRSAQLALGNVEIDELTGEGQVVSIWTLKNAFITSAKFGDLDYGGDELLNIDITFRYDWAAYEQGPGFEIIRNLQ
tara:strand:- start:1447 stop:2037 length:591 start_codon:yes stop_codon:yes gene_type:complete